MAEQTFDQHIICHIIDSQIELFSLKLPDSKLNCIEFLLRQGVLFVTGDWGNAIYDFCKKDITLLEISKFDISYFHKKCKASPVGSNFIIWDPIKAREFFERQYQFCSDDLRKIDFSSQISLNDCLCNLKFPFEIEDLDSGFEIHPWCQQQWCALQVINED